MLYKMFNYKCAIITITFLPLLEDAINYKKSEVKFEYLWLRDILCVSWVLYT